MVANIAVWHEHMGLVPAKIASQYHLSLIEVYTALAYHFDYLEKIDGSG
jgi:uncharacterized protein (DUF433 family)